MSGMYRPAGAYHDVRTIWPSIVWQAVLTPDAWAWDRIRATWIVERSSTRFSVTTLMQYHWVPPLPPPPDTPSGLFPGRSSPPQAASSAAIASPAIRFFIGSVLLHRRAGAGRSGHSNRRGRNRHRLPSCYRKGTLGN